VRFGLAKLAAKPVSGGAGNFYSVDFLRGLAALAILIFHLKNFVAGGGDLSRDIRLLDRVPVITALQVIRENGPLAVMLFWTISGFVFMNVYADTRPTARQFWVKRLARLYPLHLLTLLLIAVIQFVALRCLGHWLIYPENDVAHFVSHLFFASAWLPGAPHSFNGPVWSVSVEVLIYGAFFLFARLAKPNLISVLAGMLIFMILMELLPSSQIPVCGTYFFGGMTAYVIFRLWPPNMRVALIALGLLGLAACWITSLVLGGHIPLTLRLMPASACLLLIAASSEATVLGVAYRRVRFIGDITYSTYMWHAPIQMLFLLGAGLQLWSVDVAFSDTFVIAYLALVCSFAWLSFRFIERPAQRWVRGWAGENSRDKPLISAP